MIDENGHYYESIWDDDDDEDDSDYGDITPMDLKGEIEEGMCMFCGAKNGMKYRGEVCFVCTECGEGIGEEDYYKWTLGDTIFIDDKAYYLDGDEIGIDYT